MSHTSTLDLQSVQGTMLIPLWGRASYSLKNENILKDPEAVALIEKLDVDFSGIEKSFGEFGGLCYVIRARILDNMLKNYLKSHPNATIVNIGCGLDTTFSRVDNGKLRWYNLDLPEAIAYRQSLLPDAPRSTCIPKSFFDLSWFDDVAFSPEDGIAFVAGGVFYFFQEEELRQVIAAMAKRFPGGELCFDAQSKLAVNFSNRMVKKAGNQGAAMYFYVNQAKALRDWSPNVVLARAIPFFQGIPRRKAWKRSTRRKMFYLGGFGMMKFIHMRFAMKPV